MKKLVAVFLVLIICATPVLASDFVPVRSTLEELGWEVNWHDGRERMVYFTTPAGEGLHIFVDEHNSIIENDRVYVHPALMMMIINVGTERPFVEPQENIHGKLTRVTYGENVAYIFGTMNGAEPHWFPLHPTVEESKRRADIFAFEFDLEEIEDIFAYARMMAYIEYMSILPDGLTLADILADDVYSNFVTNMESWSFWVTYDSVNMLTPIAILLGLDHAAFLTLGIELYYMVDNYILNFAMINDKPTMGLNTMYSEIDLLFNVPLEIQAYALKDFLSFENHLDNIRESNPTEMYAAQDLEGLRAVEKSICEGTSANPFTMMFNYNLRDSRRRIFADRIADFLLETDEPSTMFAAVRIQHIIDCGCGKNLLYLLEEMGFEIEPLWQDA
ncbi:MAG: TraB/GumN family protein [Defluviitaleaceae bacterium]|nr:TraB/GumN family protein [Defluviitaleaceae bacterium]